jgi:hypothetical protein
LAARNLLAILIAEAIGIKGFEVKNTADLDKVD